MTFSINLCIINFELVSRKVRKLYRDYFLALSKLRERKHKLFLFAGISFSWVAISISIFLIYFSYLNNSKREVLGANTSASKVYAAGIKVLVVTVTIAPTNTPTPTYIPPTPTSIPPTPTAKPTNTPVPTSPQNPSQYTAEKVGDNTWKVSNVINDGTMASPQDISNALNSYRTSHGVSSLSWDGGLASYSQGRADLFAKNGSLDSHAGFNDFMKNDGFSKVGFNSLGENSAYLSGPMNADKIIKDIFGADGAHDGNQLDPSWTHVGVGVSGNAVNVNFGKNKK